MKKFFERKFANIVREVFWQSHEYAQKHFTVVDKKLEYHGNLFNLIMRYLYIKTLILPHKLYWYCFWRPYLLFKRWLEKMQYIIVEFENGEYYEISGKYVPYCCVYNITERYSKWDERDSLRKSYYSDNVVFKIKVTEEAVKHFKHYDLLRINKPKSAKEVKYRFNIRDISSIILKKKFRKQKGVTICWEPYNEKDALCELNHFQKIDLVQSYQYNEDELKVTINKSPENVKEARKQIDKFIKRKDWSL